MFTMTIKTDNAAFCDEESNGVDEIGNVMTRVYKRLVQGDFEGTEKDGNGNTVCTFSLTAG